MNLTDMTELDPARARRAIVEHTQRLAESAAATHPDTAVPTTPEWTVKDLVEHVGQTQHWVAEIVERRISDPTQLPTDVAVLPPDHRDWPAWLTESAQRVASACSDDALEAQVFNAAGDDRSGTQFWLTSSVNEAVLHGVDAAIAAGRTADIEPDVAAALISNHLAMLTSPTWGLRRAESAQALRGTGQILQWEAADGGAWYVERRPEGATWQPGNHQADVTVTGPAQSILLTLTRRIPLTGPDSAGISIHGDATLLQHWIENTAHVSG